MFYFSFVNLRLLKDGTIVPTAGMVTVQKNCSTDPPSYLTPVDDTKRIVGSDPMVFAQVGESEHQRLTHVQHKWASTGNDDTVVV